MIYKKNKKAFSMVTAVFVIFMMASLTALVMNVTGKTVKATTAQYQKEQAQLLARSYTELAILYVLYYDRNTTPPSCIENINDHFGASSPNGYDINISVQYIGNTSLLNGCGSTIETWTETDTGFNSTVSLIIDTYISYRDINDPTTNRFRRFYRRTLQKL